MKTSSKYSAKVAVGALLLVLGLIPVSSFGQADSSDSEIFIDTTMFTRGDIFANDSPVTSPINFEERLSQNPSVALFKSMVIPGWGQLGNKSYFKSILFAGLDIWFVGSAIHYGRQSSDFRAKWISAIELDNAIEYHSLYDDRRDRRNKFTWYAVIVTFVAMFDAYVDAHLSGFPATQTDDLALEIVPSENGNITAAITYSF